MDVLLAGLLILAVGASLPALCLFLDWQDRRESRHARCLRNIEQLERELGIVETPPANYVEYGYEWTPGQTWIINEPGDVALLPSGRVVAKKKREWDRFYGDTSSPYP